MKTITNKHTVDCRQQPLAVVADFPGLDAELTPAQLRALSAALAVAAHECEAFGEAEATLRGGAQGADASAAGL